MPEIVLDFSDKNLTAYLENETQRTESTTVTGSSEYYLTLDLQNGVTLVNETRGTESTGKVNIYGGDTFYLKAPLTVNGTWTSENIENCKYEYQPIVYRTTDSSQQDLAGKLMVIEDPSTTTNLSVKWLSTGNLTVHKIDSETNTDIANTTFALKNGNGDIIATATTNSKGIAKFEDINIGNYILVETKANNNYILDTKETKVTITSEDKYIELTNEYKKGNLVIYKVDADDKSIVIPNTVFDIYDSKNNLIDTIKTDNQGIARLNNIKIDTYKIVEKSTSDYYNIDVETTTATVKYAKEYGDIEVTITNSKKTGYIEIYKYDMEDTSVKLSNVKFGIYDSNNKLIETLTTNSQGYAKSSKLALDKEYIVKEISTQEDYLLNENTWKVNLTEEGIVDGYTYTLRVRK